MTRIAVSFKDKVINVPVSVVLILVLLLATFIRFFKLEYTGLWLDEIYSMKGSDPSTTIEDVYEYSTHDQPPLFFIVLHLWFKLVGYTEFAARSLTAIFGVLGVFAVYKLGKEFLNEKAGLFAAFLTSLSWMHVYISVEARFYSLVFLLSCFSYVYFVRSLKDPRFRNFALYTVFTSLLLNTHYFGMVVLATQLITFLLVIYFFKLGRKVLDGGLVSGMIAGISLMHWFPVLVHDLEITKHWVQPHTVKYLVKFLWWLIYDPAAFVIFLICAVLAFGAFYWRLLQKTFSMEDAVLISWLVFGFALPLIYSLIKMPLFTTKYLTVQLPAIYMVFAYGFLQMREATTRYVLASLLLASGLYVLLVCRPPFKKSWQEGGREFFIMYFTPGRSNEYTTDEDWREIALYFKKENYGEREVVFSQLAWFHSYYFQKFGLKPIMDQKVTDVPKAAANADRVWLLLHDFYTGGWPTKGFSEAQKNFIRAEFNLTQIVRFKRTRAFLYERKR